jgi:hypothetical protein
MGSYLGIADEVFLGVDVTTSATWPLLLPLLVTRVQWTSSAMREQLNHCEEGEDCGNAREHGACPALDQ